jgi:cobalt/nickel transport system permease protein
MSHIHIPDGVIPFGGWALGFLITFGILFVLTRKLSKEEARRKVPYTGMAAALMLITMSVPLGVVPVHLSLATLTGILVGPGLGFLAVFVVNVILAFVGHGGITVVGINTLVIGLELLVGVYIFRLLIKKWRRPISSAFATAGAIIASLVIMVLVVGNTVGWAEVLPHHDHDHEDHYEKYHGDEDYLEEGEDHHEEDFHETLEEVHYLMFTGWTAVFLIIIAGILLEAIITAVIIRFFMKIRPDLIESSHTNETQN